MKYTTPAAKKENDAICNVLLQLFSGVTSDGDLISKSDRTWLLEQGLATRVNGWNMITPVGVKYLEDLKLIHH